MVFRRDKAGDSFQRQINALRQQLGGESDSESDQEEARQTQERSAQGEPYSRSFGFGAEESGQGEYTPAEPAPTHPELPNIPPVDATTTVIANNTVWKGELTSEGSIHVHGRFEGTIRAREDVVIAEEANVDATVTAERVVIAGTVTGSIRCRGRFEALPTGRVTADIQTPTVVVHEGAVINGQFRMGAADTTETAETAKPTSVIQRRQARGTA